MARAINKLMSVTKELKIEKTPKMLCLLKHCPNSLHQTSGIFFFWPVNNKEEKNSVSDLLLLSVEEINLFTTS